MWRSRLGNSSAEMGVGVTVNDKPSMSQQCHTVVKMASVTLRYRNKNKVSETGINPSVLPSTGKNTGWALHSRKAWSKRK